jgi:integrase
MATRKPSRSEWHQHNGLWSRSLGYRGIRVRLFQKRSGGMFYRAMWVPGRGFDRKCVGTSNRVEAEKLGKALLVAMLKDEHFPSAGVLSLCALWERYKTESVTFKDYPMRMRKEFEARVQILYGFFRKDCDVRGLTEQDQVAFVKKRLAGGIVTGWDADGKDKLTRSVRARSAQADLEVLRSMIHWATTFRVSSGVRLLDRNPLAGVRLPARGSNPRRPVATQERFTATRQAIALLRDESETESDRLKWLKLDLALVLAHATGRRLGSIRQLAWRDVDLTANKILWRAESDKKKKEWKVPIPAALREELWAFRVKLGGVFGGLLFPCDTVRSQPVRRDVLAKWLQQAERKAGLPKLDGSLWHAYRRGWATSRKGLPTVDVAAAGGWSEVGTLLRCYQQPDDATMLAVMSHEQRPVEQQKGA